MTDNKLPIPDENPDMQHFTNAHVHVLITGVESQTKAGSDTDNNNHNKLIKQ